MDVQSLLKDCEALTHSERVRKMARLGHMSKTNASASTIIDELSRGDLYEQVLSLETCHGSRRIDIALRALVSPSKYLEKRAIKMVTLLGTDEQLIEALKAASSYLQIHMLRRFKSMRRGRERQRVIDTFLEDLEKEIGNEQIFKGNFPLGSRELVVKTLPRLQDSLSQLEWSCLAKYHPDIANSAIFELAARSEHNDTRLCEVANTVMAIFLRKQAYIKSALHLVTGLLGKMSIEQFPIGQLISKAAESVVRTILDCKDDISTDVMSALNAQSIKKIPTHLFLQLAKRYPCIATRWNFPYLNREQQLLIYQMYNTGWRKDDGELSIDIVSNLPEKERLAEARRHIKLLVYQTKPVLKVPYIALLPWDEALPLQMPFLKDSDVGIRARALGKQIAAAKWDEEKIAEALRMVLFRKNEQDGVKGEMMRGLAQIPLGRWREEHLSDLAVIVRNTLDAGDTSTLTIKTLLGLVVDLTTLFPEWSKTQLEIIMCERDEMPQWTRPSGLVPVKQTMAIIASAMSAKLKKLLANKNGSALRNLAIHFNPHTKHWSGLLSACEESLQIPEMVQYRSQMVDILKQYQPRTWHRIVPQLISEETETSGLQVLLDYVHYRQQNLLWENYIVSGKWWTQSALHNLTGGFWRWTPKQQAGFASLLLKETENKDKDIKDRCRAIQQLGLLAYHTVDPLIKLANENAKPVLQERALRTLGRIDGKQGIAVLIEALGDHRARIAIYALKRTLKSMSKIETMLLLRSVPQDKVTVVKETLRLIGELRTEDAFQYLLERSGENLHHDVRVALFRALSSFLDRDETWEIFMRAAVNPDAGIAEAVIHLPQDGMDSVSREKLLRLLRLALYHEEAVVRMAVLRLGDISPSPLADADADAALYSRLVELVMKSQLKDEVYCAANAIFSIYAITRPDLIEEFYRRVIESGERKIVQKVHETYCKRLRRRDLHKRTRPTTIAILNVLKSDRLSVVRRVRTMFSYLPWSDLRPLLLDILPELHAEALVAFTSALEKRAEYWLQEIEREGMKTMELELARSESEGTRRLALSLLIGRIGEDGWNKEQRERLEGYRRDESAMIAEAAWEVDVPDNKVDGEDDEITDAEGS